MRTVPAHKACNTSFSEDNEHFRNVLILEQGAVHKREGAKTVAENTIHRIIEDRTARVLAFLGQIVALKVPDIELGVPRFWSLRQGRARLYFRFVKLEVEILLSRLHEQMDMLGPHDEAHT